jgi:beta-galactosidase
VRETGSRGAFSATGAPPEEDWQWFLTTVPAGRHDVSYRLAVPGVEAKCGVFVRGAVEASKQADPFDSGPVFPLDVPARRSWSRTLAPVSTPDAARLVERRVSREIVKIDGVFLDTLEWAEATAGWGEVHRNASVMGRPMTMAGRLYRRGLGTHAVSRIAYDLPEGYRRFAATIGCDQEVAANTVIFVVEGDGRELYRSPVMRRDSAPIDLNLPMAGVGRLTLIVEDAGDGIAADHGNWADARLLR